MVMQGGIGDGEVQADSIKKWRIGQGHPVRGEIRGRPEHQRITADAKRLAREQRRRTAAILVRREIEQRRAIAVAQPAYHAGGGHAAGRVQNMRGQSPHNTPGLQNALSVGRLPRFTKGKRARAFPTGRRNG